jgi:hypothetical protein
VGGARYAPVAHVYFDPFNRPLTVNGRQALFPSSYVEKIESDPEPQVPHQRMLPPQYDEKPDKPMYRPFGAALHGADLPPPSGSEVNSVGLQQAPGQEQKKDRFGKYKGTVRISLSVWRCFVGPDGFLLFAMNSWLNQLSEV